MKLNNKGWNCKKIIKKRTQNKRNCNNKNDDQIKKKIQSND
jgi:hypothetical protein